MALDPDVQAAFDKLGADFKSFADDMSGQVADLKTQVQNNAPKADVLAAIQSLDDTINAAKTAADTPPPTG